MVFALCEDNYKRSKKGKITMRPSVYSHYQKPTFYQKLKSFVVDTFNDKKSKTAMVIIPAVATANVAMANTVLPELTIDVSSLMKAFAVIIASIATIGMGVLTVALMAKAFKYIRAAF